MSSDIQQPLRLSPLHVAHTRLGAGFESRAGWQVPQVYSAAEAEVGAVRERVGVADISPVGKVLVRGNAQDLLVAALGSTPAAVGGVVDLVFKDAADVPLGAGYVARLMVDEFLLVTPVGVAQRIVGRVEQWRMARHANGVDSHVAIVDRTSGLAGALLAGPHSTELLSKLSALPVAGDRFPDRHVAQTGVAKVHAIVVRRDVAGAGSYPSTAFELYVDRPYGEYLWDAVLDAGREFGSVPFGTAARESLGEAF